MAKENKYTSLLLASNKTLIKREERFAKTAVGWILRELSKIDEGIVVNFINANKEYFSKESLENSIKYFDNNIMWGESTSWTIFVTENTDVTWLTDEKRVSEGTSSTP